MHNGLVPWMYFVLISCWLFDGLEEGTGCVLVGVDVLSSSNVVIDWLQVDGHVVYLVWS